ncbi:hypothetical protein NKH95_10820 [Mesorhizobium sp. M0848]|uniref:hypothetical protein n=1 Tax=Mesorhizobium sp. M0848 TaxID=2957012 RepID=UPI00333C079C
MQNMTFYHFTSAESLLGIGRHGLTVGDVPTDIAKMRGLVGVWLTSSPLSDNHGLGKQYDKRRYRLTVELPVGLPTLHKWTEWSKQYVTPQTITGLQDTASAWDTWYIVLGVVPADGVIACIDVQSGETIHNWREIKLPGSEKRIVPPWRREAWQKRMFKQVSKALAMRAK